MNSKVEYELGLKFIISIIGCAGIISIPLTALEMDYALGAEFVCCIIFPILFVALFSLKKMYRRYAYSVTGVLLVFFWAICAQKITAGIGYLYDDFCRIAFESYTNDFFINRYEESQKLVAIIFFTIICAAVTSAVVVFARSFAAALLSVIPVLGIFVWFVVIPSTLSFALCIIYVLTVATMYGKRINVVGAFSVMSVGIICAFFYVFVFLPVDNYERPELFDKAYEMVVDLIENRIGINFSGSSRGKSTADGELGDVDSIKYNYNKVASLTTISTGHTQYIRQYVGIQYRPYNNDWEKESNGQIQDSYSKSAFNNYDTNSDLKNYLGYSDFTDNDYYNEYLAYDITFKLIKDAGNSDPDKKYETTQMDAFCVRSGNYNVFSNKYISRKSTYEQRLYHGKVKSTCLYVPEETKNMLNKYLGEDFFVKEGTDLEYVDKVKKYLSDNYKYTLSPGMVPQGEDFLTYFLTQSKKGYCTYFATAGTMILRNAGIPARYCEGYVATDHQIKNGTPVEKTYIRYNTNGTVKNVAYDTYNVSINDSAAHAWVEIFIENFGWLPVEMTPGYDANDMTFDDEGTEKESEVSSESSTEVLSSTEESISDTEGEAEEKTEVTSTEITSSDITGTTGGKANGTVSIDGKTVLWITVTAITGSFILIIAAFAISKAKERRRLLKKSDMGNRERVVGLYVYLNKLLAILGYKKEKTCEYENFAKELMADNEIFADFGIDEAVNATLKARFSDEEISDEDLAKIYLTVLKLREYTLKRVNPVKRIWLIVFRGL